MTWEKYGEGLEERLLDLQTRTHGSVPGNSVAGEHSGRTGARDR